jgi:hypothetical protein
MQSIVNRVQAEPARVFHFEGIREAHRLMESGADVIGRGVVATPGSVAARHAAIGFGGKLGSRAPLPDSAP